MTEVQNIQNIHVQKKYRVYGEVWSLGSCGGAWSLDLKHMCEYIKREFNGKCERVCFEEPLFVGPDCVRTGRVKVKIDAIVPEDKLSELIDTIAWGLGHWWSYPSEIFIDKKNKRIVLRWKLIERILNFEEVQ